jgi:hypothetical protein
MGAQGTTTVDFGAYPGTTDVAVTVTGQTGILSGSLVEAWILPAATSTGGGTHSADEHWLDPPDVVAGNIVAGTGFTVYAKTRDQRSSQEGLSPGSSKTLGGNEAPDATCYGPWNVAWCWN